MQSLRQALYKYSTGISDADLDSGHYWSKSLTFSDTFSLYVQDRYDFQMDENTQEYES